jgi:hypothetical protein
MADAQDIKFKLSTEGDTKGAEKVIETLKDTRTEAQKLQSARDVETVQAAKAAEAEKQHADALREIADAQHVIIASMLADKIRDIGQAFKGMNKEVDLAIDGASNFLNVFATSGNVFLALGAVAATATKGVMDAATAGDKAIESSQKRAKEALEALISLRAEYAQRVREQKLESEYEEETAALTKQRDMLREIAKLNSENAVTERKVEAVTGPEANPMQKVEDQRVGSLNDLRSKINAAEADAERAAMIALKATYHMQQVAAQSSVESNAYEAAQAALLTAQRNAETASKNADLISARAEIEKKEIAVAAIKGFESVKNSGIEVFEANTKGVIDAFQKAKADGLIETTNATDNLVSQIKARIEDEIPNEKQITEINQLLSQLRSSQGEKDQKVFGTVTEIVNINNQIAADYRTVTAELARMKRDIAQARADFAAQINDLPR